SWANPMIATHVAAWVRASMYAGRARFCIHVPMLEANSPIHRMRKLRYVSAARAVPRRADEGARTSAAELLIGGAADQEECVDCIGDVKVSSTPGVPLSRGWGAITTDKNR